MKAKRTRTNLSNGLPLVVVEIPHSTSLAISFWTKAGNRADPLGKPGMAHFLEHLLIKKTKKYPQDAKLAEVLESVGAHQNGVTSRDWLHLYISSAAKDLSLTANVLAEIVFNPLIEKKSFNAERKVVLQEQVRKQSRPEDLVWEVWFKMFFHPSPLTASGLGDRTSMNSMKVEELIKFWDKYYHLDDGLLFISGGVSFQEAFKIAEKAFGKYRLKAAVPLPVYKYSGDKKILVEKKMLPQASMLFSFRLSPGFLGEKLYALILLRSILSRGWSSRISKRLRVKESLLYNWGSSIQRYVDSRALCLNLFTSKEKFGKMTSILCEELVKVRKEGISRKELELHKGFIEGGMLAGFETSSSYVDWYADYDLLWPSEVETPKERLRKIKKVTQDEVNSVARMYIGKDNWNLAIVGDVKKEDIRVEL